MGRPKISVVVPVYGVEKYLNECVDSILNQTIKDIEVILVDDGSKDKCPQIIDEYAKKDSRVVAIHQENGGYGKAVNHGISVARGEFIGIIESDDWIEPDMYEKLLHEAEQTDSDITKCSFFSYNSFSEKKDVAFDSDLCKIASIPDESFSLDSFPSILAFPPSIWSCLYKSSFIKVQKVQETKSASYQDLPFFVESLCRAERISFVKEYLVHYRQEFGQNSSTLRTDDRLLYLPKQWILTKELLKKYNKYDMLKEFFTYQCFCACLGAYRCIQWKYKKDFMNILRELYEDLLSDNTFSYKYFSKHEKNILAAQAKGSIWGGLGMTLKMIRQFLVRINIKRNVFLFQFLGVQFTNKKEHDFYQFPKPILIVKF